MADISIPVKTYILKVNLQCCEACPKKLEKLLMNTDGVYAFKINTKKGLVKVASMVDLDILKRNIKKKVGKIAEIYDRKCDNKNRGKHQCRVDNSDSDSSDDDQAHHGVHNTRPMPRAASGSISWHHQQNNIKRKDVFDPRMCGSVPGPQLGIARPPYYGQVPYRSGHYGPGMYNRPPPIAPPPPPPPHGYDGARLPGPYVHSLYEPRELPNGNSMFHAIRDDNVRAMAPPPPPPGYYGARVPGPYVHTLNDLHEPLKGNSMFHAISDDNVGASPCTIM